MAPLPFLVCCLESTEYLSDRSRLRVWFGCICDRESWSECEVTERASWRGGSGSAGRGVLGASWIRSRGSGTCEERTTVFSFSGNRLAGACGWKRRLDTRTKVQGASSACIQTEGCFAGRAFLTLKLLDVLVEASLVSDVTARQLQDTLATERVFKRLLTDGAFTPYECPVSSCFGTCHINHRVRRCVV